MKSVRSADSQVIMPTSSRRELPDEATLSLAGIDMPLEHARLVAAILSRFIARGRSKTLAKTNQLIYGLVAACTLTLEREDEVIQATHPGLTAFSWPTGATAMRRLGIDHEAIREYWVSAKNRGSDACLPLDWLLEFFPATLWPAVLTFVTWGPDRSQLWTEEMVIRLAQKELSFATRRRPVGSLLSAGTICTYVCALWQVMDELVDLRTRVLSWDDGSLPRDLLTPWTHKPKRPDLEACGAREARLDVAGPPLDECASRLRQLAADIDARPRDRYRAHQRLLTFAFLCLYGFRVDAIRLLRREDYLVAFVFNDGTQGPALRYFPGKTRPHDDPSYLPVPAELAKWLEDWLDLSGDHTVAPGSPLFPNRRFRAGNEAVFLGRSGMYRLIAGKPSRGGSGSIALLPRNGDRYTGWHPHAFRHTAFQGARRAGVQAMTAAPQEYATVEPNDFARALVDHELIRHVADTYRDIDKQRLSRVAVEGAWAFLWGGGSMRGPDLEELSRTRADVEEHEATVATMMAELRTLQDRQTRLLKRSRTSKGEALNKLTMRSHSVVVATQVLNHDLEELRINLAGARAALDVATTVQVPIPTDVTRDDYELRLALALGDTDRDVSAPLADELTVSDLAELFETSTQCINVWYRHGPPYSRPAPWRQDPTAWHVHNSKHKRLRVEAIERNALTGRQLVRLAELRRRRSAADTTRTNVKARASSRLALPMSQQ
jgi:hypothetical protein